MTQKEMATRAVELLFSELTVTDMNAPRPNRDLAIDLIKSQKISKRQLRKAIYKHDDILKIIEFPQHRRDSLSLGHSTAHLTVTKRSRSNMKMISFKEHCVIIRKDRMTRNNVTSMIKSIKNKWFTHRLKINGLLID